MPAERVLNERSSTATRILVLLPFIAIAAIIWSCPALPFLDLPNHLSRSYAIAFHADESVASRFWFAPKFVPYILGDLIFAGLLRVFDPSVAGRIWMIALFLATPLASFALLRARNSSASSTMFFLCMSYLGTSYFYVSAFHSYLLSIPMALLAVTAWELWQKRPGPVRFAGFATFCVLVYLSHLAGFFFLGVWLAASTFVRLLRGQSRFRHAVATSLPIILLVALHVSGKQLGSGSEAFEYRSAREKFLALGGMFIRWDYPTDIMLFLVFGTVAGTMVFAAVRGRENLNTNSVTEWLALSAVFFGCYFVLPMNFRPAFDVDSRSLPFATFTVFFAVLEAVPRHYRERQAVVMTAALLATLNVLSIGYWLGQDRVLFQALDQAVRAVPPGKILLPINTWEQRGRLDRALHYGELYTVYGHGIVPDIFSNTTSKNQFPYFAYHYHPYSPGPFWYAKEEDHTVRWKEIEEQYDFVLVTKPFDPRRIKLITKVPIFENQAAIVYAMPGPDR